MNTQSDAIVIHGHRGARGLAPENSLSAFRRACEIGVDGLELDVLISKDERVVIHHDHRLNSEICRGPDGRWVDKPAPRVRDLTAPELQTLDIGRIRPGSSLQERFPEQQSIDGEKIPLLADLAAWWETLHGQKPILNIELKSHPDRPDDTPPARDYARIVIEEIRRYGLEAHTWLQAFDWRLLLEVKRQAPKIWVGFLSSENDEEPTVLPSESSPWLAGFDPFRFNHSVSAAIKAAGGDYWGPWIGDLSAKTVRQAKDMGLGVHPWTVNSAEQMESAIRWGVTGLTTDYPDRARAVFINNGMEIPQPCI